jgi:hypothetical protein
MLGARYHRIAIIPPGQVGTCPPPPVVVLHGDAVMQPGPRDGHGSTIGLIPRIDESSIYRVACWLSRVVLSTDVEVE